MKLALPMFISILCCTLNVQASELPKTLFEIAGAKPDPGKLSNSVLIIVDAQREYVDGALPLIGVKAAIAETEQLLLRARKAGTPVIHIVHKGKGAIFNPNGHYFEIVSPLHPQSNESIVEKMRTSAFAETTLAELIQHTNRKSLIIVGFITHNCISSTARDARDLGYNVTIVANATATRDLPDGKGGVIPASTIQASSLAELADRNAWIVQTEQDIQE